MARIRTIKPEFQQSESMGAISRDARLLFVQLWTYVDDEGRGRASSRMLASILFPYDDDAPGLIGAWLDELERERCVVRYTVDGTNYLHITNWAKHQKIDKPTPSKIPPVPSRSFENIREPSKNTREQSDTDLDLGPRKGEDLGKDHPPSATREPKSNFEAECRKRVGEEPVLLAMDFHEIAALVAPPDLTEADVLAGIDAAMASKDFRPRRWKQLAGWARRAAQDRLAGQDKRISGHPEARAGPRGHVPQISARKQALLDGIADDQSSSYDLSAR